MRKESNGELRNIKIKNEVREKSLSEETKGWEYTLEGSRRECYHTKAGQS